MKSRVMREVGYMLGREEECKQSSFDGKTGRKETRLKM
jgi:hypothetical protein